MARPVTVAASFAPFLVVAGCGGEVQVGEFDAPDTSSATAGGAEPLEPGGGGSPPVSPTATSAEGNGATAGPGGGETGSGGFAPEPELVDCEMAWATEPTGSGNVGPRAKSAEVATSGDRLIQLVFDHRPEDAYRHQSFYVAQNDWWTDDPMASRGFGFADGWTGDGPHVVGRARRAVPGGGQEGVAFVQYKMFANDPDEDPPIVRVAAGYATESGTVSYEGGAEFVEVAPVLALAPAAEDDMLVALGEGGTAWVARLAPRLGEQVELVPLDVAACGDRDLAAAAAPLGSSALFALADSPREVGAPCDEPFPGEPTRVRLVTAGGDGTIVAESAIDLASAPVELKLASADDGAWLAVRTGGDWIELHHVGTDGRPSAAPFTIDVPASRPFALAAGGGRVAVADTGDDLGASRRVRVRLWNQTGELVGRAEPMGAAVVPEGAPSLVVGPAGDRVVVVFPYRLDAENVAIARVRAECSP